MSKRPHPDPEVQALCQKKYDEIDAIRAELAALSDRSSKKSVVTSSTAKPAATERAPQASLPIPRSSKPIKKLATVPVTAKDARKKGKSAEPVKNPKVILKVKPSGKTDQHLPNINAHRNRSQFWRAQNGSAVEEYRSLTDVERLERAARLKAAYE